jgi:hypothetical protein
MAMKAPRQEASAAPSSERTGVDRAAAGDNREEAGIIQKTRLFYNGFRPCSPAPYTQMHAMFTRGGPGTHEKSWILGSPWLMVAARW